MRQKSGLLIVMLSLGLSILVAAPTPALARTSEERAALNIRLPEAKLINVTFADAMSFIHDVAGANITVDWKSIEALNITRDVLVNIDLREVRVEKILRLVLSQAGPGDLLTFYIDDNVIQVTSRVTADANLVTVVYDVSDLVALSDNFVPTVVNLNTTGQNGGSGSTGGTSGAGTNPFGGQFTGGLGVTGNNQQQGGNAASGGGNGSRQNGGDTTANADKLIKVIQNIIRPDVWRTNGGTAVIEYFNGKLIVSAPRSVQEAIGGPLE